MKRSVKMLVLGVAALGFAGIGTASLADSFGAASLDTPSIVKNGTKKPDSGKMNMRGATTCGQGFWRPTRRSGSPIGGTL